MRDPEEDQGIPMWFALALLATLIIVISVLVFSGALS